MTDKTLLHPHDPFPALTVCLPGGRALRLPDDLAGHFGVVLLYRGSWCPYCNAQLSAFQRALDGLAEMDMTVVALSVDDEATTQQLIAKPMRPARSSTMTRCSCSRPGSCSTPPAGSWSACTPAAPSGAWSPRTSSASSATCVNSA
jgi:thiol-disulfide isomerase/thioredoxin